MFDTLARLCSSCKRLYFWSLFADYCCLCRYRETQEPGWVSTVAKIARAEGTVLSEGAVMKKCLSDGCDGLAPSYLGGVCETCCWVKVRQMMDQRKELLLSISRLEKEISLRVELLQSDPQHMVRPSILHHCACGFSSLSFIEVDNHIDDYPTNGGHYHAPRQMLTPAPKKPRQRSCSTVMSDGSSDDISDISELS